MTHDTLYRVYRTCAKRAEFVMWDRECNVPVITMRLAMKTGPGTIAYYQELVEGSRLPVHPEAHRLPGPPWAAVRQEPGYAVRPTDDLLTWLEHHKLAASS